VPRLSSTSENGRDEEFEELSELVLDGMNAAIAERQTRAVKLGCCRCRKLWHVLTDT